MIKNVSQDGEKPEGLLVPSLRDKGLVEDIGEQFTPCGKEPRHGLEQDNAVFSAGDTCWDGGYLFL